MAIRARIALFGAGVVFVTVVTFSVLVYALGWLLIPEEGKETSIVQELINKQQQKTP